MKKEFTSVLGSNSRTKKKEALLTYLLYQYRNDIKVIEYQKSLLDETEISNIKKVMKYKPKKKPSKIIGTKLNTKLKEMRKEFEGINYSIKTENDGEPITNQTEVGKGGLI